MKVEPESGVVRHGFVGVVHQPPNLGHDRCKLRLGQSVGVLVQDVRVRACMRPDVSWPHPAGENRFDVYSHHQSGCDTAGHDEAGDDPKVLGADLSCAGFEHSCRRIVGGVANDDRIANR